MKPKELEIEVFKTGEITDHSGNTREWSIDDLNNIATTYNEALKIDEGVEAPIVKGHPETDAPAYGWVKQLYVVGDKLKAKIAMIPQFAEEVKNELFKKVSIALDENLLLKHLGFLGAVHPAVKGLANVKLSENNKTLLEYSTSEEPVIINAEPVEFAMAQKESLVRTKPSQYSDYTDGDFGDPVHFRFPLKTASDVKASLAIFSRPNVKAQYTEEERQYVASRIIMAASNHNIKLTGQNWAYANFVQVPIEILNKNQLLEVVKQLDNNNQQNYVTPKQDTQMPEKMENEWLQTFIKSLVTKLAEISSEEVAAQTQSYIDEYLAANPLPMDEATGEQGTTAPAQSTQPAQPTTASENEITKIYAERILALERENRNMKNETYFSENVKAGKLTPAQKDIVFAALELGHKNTEKLMFSEGGKSVQANGESIVKKLINSFPTQVEMTEIARREFAEQTVVTDTMELPRNASVDTASVELDKRVRKYMEDNKVSNYTQALIEVFK